MNTKLLISATVAAAAFAVNVHAAGGGTSGDLNTIDKWYGRAGGLTAADVAARTNMPPGQSGAGPSEAAGIEGAKSN